MCSCPNRTCSRIEFHGLCDERPKQRLGQYPGTHCLCWAYVRNPTIRAFYTLSYFGGELEQSPSVFYLFLFFPLEIEGDGHVLTEGSHLHRKSEFSKILRSSVSQLLHTADPLFCSLCPSLLEPKVPNFCHHNVKHVSSYFVAQKKYNSDTFPIFGKFLKFSTPSNEEDHLASQLQYTIII